MEAQKSLADQLLAKYDKRSLKNQETVVQHTRTVTRHMKWVPTAGPQTEGYDSEVDLLHYGGQAGGGKSQLLLGWGANESNIGIIFRRELTQTDGLEADGKQIIGDTGRWNGVDHEWTWPSGKTLKLAGMREPDSWMAHAGRERDFIGFDEAGEFLEKQVASMFAWLRSEGGRRTRMIFASNPPRTAEGQWIIDWFAPWLDATHDLYGAEDGEVMWCVYTTQPDGTGLTTWVDGPGEYEVDGEHYNATSRTFIHASLADNPYRNTPEYRAKLQSLPEPLRSQLLKGDYLAGLQDQANQTIPTDWVRQAQARWEDKIPDGIPQCAIGVDAAGGGEDNMVLAPRHDAWFAPLVIVPGADIPQARSGTFCAGLVVSHRRDGALVVVDMGGGYGGPLYEQLVENEVESMAYKGAEGTGRRTEDKKLGFTNVRSAAYWSFREALDPDQPGGSVIKLPPSKRLLAGLCAPTFEVTARGIKLEAKSKREGGSKGVVERLGWSPDEADAVVMAWWAGPRMSTHALEWIDGPRRKMGKHGTQPKVILSKRQQARRRR